VRVPHPRRGSVEHGSEAEATGRRQFYRALSPTLTVACFPPMITPSAPMIATAAPISTPAIVNCTNRVPGRMPKPINCRATDKRTIATPITKVRIHFRRPKYLESGKSHSGHTSPRGGVQRNDQRFSSSAAGGGAPSSGRRVSGCTSLPHLGHFTATRLVLHSSIVLCEKT